jgi:hypothetical protein
MTDQLLESAYRAIATQSQFGLCPLKTHGTPTHIEAMDTPGDWTPAHCTLALDEDYYSCTTDPENPGSIKLSVSNYTYGNMIKTLGSSIDVSGSNLSLRYYIPEGAGATSWEYISHISVYLRDTNEYYRYWKVYDSTASAAVPGWHTWTGTLGEYTGKGSPDLDTSAVTSFKVVVGTSGASSPVVIFDSLVFTPKLSKGLVQFIFTGGNVSQIHAAAYLAANGIPGTFLINGGFAGTTGPVGSTEYRMTAEQARVLQNAGHLIGSNGWQRTHMATDSADTVRNDLIRNQVWLAKNGLGAGARIHFQHYPDWIANGYDILDDLTDMVYRAADTDTTGAIKKTRPLYDPRRQFISGYQDSQAAYTDAVDAAIANGSIATHYFNNVGSGEHLTWAQFKAVVDDVVGHRDGGDLLVVMPSDLLRNNLGI